MSLFLDEDTGTFVLECDSCGDSVEIKAHCGSEALVFAMREGWGGAGSTENIAAMAFCPDCAHSALKSLGILDRESRPN